jgi:CRP-like cAMP-binding protein
MNDLAAQLAKAPLFRHLASEHLQAVSGCAAQEAHPAEELLLRQGEQADALYLLLSGSASLELEVPGRAPLVIATLGAGELVGASWVLSTSRVQFDVRARTALEVIRFDVACLQARFDADPALGHAFCRRFLAVVAERLQATRLQLMDLYGHPELFRAGCDG